MKNNFTFVLLLNTLIAFGQFGPQKIIYNNSLNPTSIQTGDLDGDNNNDVVIAYAEMNRIVWYQNQDGEGVFNDEKIITTDLAAPQSIILADLDDDGDMDVVAASGEDNTVAWFRNEDGQGNFSDNLLINNNAVNAEFIQVADIDNDDDLDVVSASSGDDKIIWYGNLDGEGNLDSGTVISETAMGVKCIFVGDLNGDNNIDVAAALNTADKIVWYENIDGAGSFGVRISVDTGFDRPEMF